MARLSFWVDALRPFAKESVVSEPRLPEVSAIDFARHMDRPSADTVYLGSPDEVADAIERASECRGITFFSSGESKELARLAEARGVNLVVSELDVLDIHGRLSAVMRRYRHWSQSLLEAAFTVSIQSVVDRVTELSGMPLFLLNSRSRVIYSSEKQTLIEPLAGELKSTGYLSENSAKLLFGEEIKAAGDELSTIFRELDSGNVCWMQKVVKDSKIISTMLLFAPSSRADFDAETMFTLTRSAISRIVRLPGGAGYWTELDFKTLLDDIVMQRVTDEKEINNRFSLISRTPQRFCTFIIIEFRNPGGIPHPTTHLFTQLEEIFPDSNAAVYDNAVVLLLSRPDRVFQPTPIFDNERFAALLTRYNAYAAISNATSRRGMLRTNYLICKSILKLGKALSLNAKQRFYFFEDYAEYFMIDLCINSFSSLLGHDDIIYLTHPDAIAVARYDKDNNTNLLDVLYHYCLNNCNIVQTAKSAYMHRNTVSSKIAKIHEIIRSDLSNVQTRQRIIFSYKILRYYDKYAKVNLKERLTVTPPPD
jgi:hypothetical protein